MDRKTDIVVTTIFEPDWLAGYLKNLKEYGHQDQVTIRIITDRKTPESVYRAAADASQQGFNIDCPTLKEQSEYLNKLGLENDFIPWDTDNRRNIGFLRAWEADAEVLISIDDDNYCRSDSDFIAAHGAVGCPATPEPSDLLSQGPWFNICDLLETQNETPIFPRGFPYHQRNNYKHAVSKPENLDSNIAINAGLWLEDPDVDALTRLTLSPHAKNASNAAVFLSDETWSPINTQNTALSRDAIPAYYYIRMGYGLEGLTLDRFGDILSGYFIQKCTKAMGHAIRIGSPVAEHKRTPHNLFKDLYHELAGIVLIEDLLPWLIELKLYGNNYIELYAELADALDTQSPKFKGFVWDQGGREFLCETADSMRRWLKVIRQISSE